MSRRLDARLALLSFGLLMPVLMSARLSAWSWWLAAGWVGVAVKWSGLSWSFLGVGLWRLRWLLVTMWLLHGLMTPGEYLWTLWPYLTYEGVALGMQQSVRLLTMALAAWWLARVTTPMELVAALDDCLGWLERVRIPVRRGLAILGFCLTTLARFQEQAVRVRLGLEWRLGTVRKGWSARWHRLACAGSSLLMILLWELRAREEGLRVRGFGRGLPLAAHGRAQPVRWWEWLVLLPGVLWITPW
ncbi:MAG: hypothetical protein G8237_01895 [Magnetococcales bacterium]|nr:hypothetical protein [Magnetococcales bacterium]NGZ05086.1 hypothetical protein [Magnetococcales bacterium]